MVGRLKKPKPCKFCGWQHGVLCPSVKAVEYFANGKVKRVEFKCESDFRPWLPPVWPTPQPPLYPTGPWVTTGYIAKENSFN